jgi:hypothetical protein
VVPPVLGMWTKAIMFAIDTAQSKAGKWGFL